jgi:hypothetical protein
VHPLACSIPDSLRCSVSQFLKRQFGGTLRLGGQQGAAGQAGTVCGLVLRGGGAAAAGRTDRRGVRCSPPRFQDRDRRSVFGAPLVQSLGRLPVAMGFASTVP